MEKNPIKTINKTYLNLRKWLGILALTLPFLLLIGNGFNVESSISHFYYTRASVLFTGALFAFGLMLLSYPGYEFDSSTETFSDNTITNLAGFLAIVTAIVPTAHPDFCECVNQISDKFCGSPNGHNITSSSTIHLVSAALFLCFIGWTVYFRFTKGDINAKKNKNRQNKLYRICAIGIWASVAAIAILFGIEYLLEKDFSRYKFVFFGEWLALLFFGFAWLTKSDSLSKIGL